MSANFTFLRSRVVQLLTGLLLLEACMVPLLAPAESVPLSRPLAEIPRQLAGWSLAHESPVDAETMELLKADDTVNRTYRTADGAFASLFIAFFKSQRAGVAPHSPKVCLPGSGWVPAESTTINIDIPGREPINVNRYIVTKGDSRSLIIYWYQTPYRVIANELTAKLYTIVDGLKHHRSDTTLVRIIVPIQGAESEAERDAIRFIQNIFNPVREFLPV